MNSRPQTLLAFTLIELLTVITIIAILMGLLFPAMGIVKEQARRAEAKVAAGQIAGAIKQYYTEYGKYPVIDYTATDATPQDVKLGDPALSGVEGDNNELFNTLRSKIDGKNVDNTYNPRRISFFEYKPASDVASPKSGFADATGSPKKGALFDPWGKQYNIIMDANYNEVINLIGIYGDFTEASQDTPADTGARTGVGVFSFGKDGQVGSPNAGVTGKFREGSKLSDDIISWQ
jgi:prepilin-type N-terminal cleavage/methylation domain-containing protein